MSEKVYLKVIQNGGRITPTDLGRGAYFTTEKFLDPAEAIRRLQLHVSTGNTAVKRMEFPIADIEAVLE